MAEYGSFFMPIVVLTVACSSQLSSNGQKYSSSCDHWTEPTVNSGHLNVRITPAYAVVCATICNDKLKLPEEC